MKTTILIIALILLSFGMWVRIAPFDETRWHTDPLVAPEKRQGGHKASLTLQGTDPASALSRVNEIALEWPRTKRVFGAPEDGRISFVTRSMLWGFPDVTTVSAEANGTDTVVTFYARLRFGRDDMGVNRARVVAWISSLSGAS